MRCRSEKFTGFHILIILLFSVSQSPEPWWIMPVASPLRLKFLKFFQIRYLESQNVLSVSDCLNQRLKVKLLGSLFNLPDFDSRNGVNSKTKWASFGIRKSAKPEAGSLRLSCAILAAVVDVNLTQWATINRLLPH